MTASRASPRKCGRAGCARPLYAKGVCEPCYAKVRRDAARGAPPPTAFGRFWARVRAAPADECWDWLGSTHDGYGRFSSAGVRHPAHAYAWILAGRPRSPGMVLDHACHNRKCVNVSHLREVTRQQNSSHQRGARRANPTGKRGVTAMPDGTFSARWRERGRDRSKRFKTEAEAERYVIRQRLRLEAEGFMLPNRADAIRARELGVTPINDTESHID